MFKVGDKVKINLGGPFDMFRDDVKALQGRIAEIRKINCDCRYRIDLDHGRFLWPESDLIPAFKTKPDIMDLATILHENFCKWNHTDMCDWYYYAANDFSPATKQKYYKAAEKLLENFGKNEIMDILYVLKDNRIV